MDLCINTDQPVVLSIQASYRNNWPYDAGTVIADSSQNKKKKKVCKTFLTQNVIIKVKKLQQSVNQLLSS